MTATLATLPLDVILSISAFLSDPLDVLSLSRTCRSTLLASQAWASYWSKLVPTAQLLRPAPWHSYSPSELRDAHIRYAATHRRWESPSPTFKPPLRLPPPKGPNVSVAYPQRWRLIRGTHWAWYLQSFTGGVIFCDLRTGHVIGKWSIGGPVIDAFIESRSPNECFFCHWKANKGDSTNEFEIVATSVTLEQENLISPIKLSFRTIQRVPVRKGIFLSNSFSSGPMVLWHDYLIGSYITATGGLFLWSMTENSIFYFQMEFVPRCTKVVDDVLFVTLVIFDGTDTDLNTEHRCIHIPSLVTSTQLPDGSLCLKKNAFAVLLPKSIMESRATGPHFPGQLQIYSIPTCPITHPRYCFIIRRFMEQSQEVQWEVLEVEIDLTIPGPIKIFSRVSRQYTVQLPFSPLHDIDGNLLFHLPLGARAQPSASPSVRFLRVGKPDQGRAARLGGVTKMRFCEVFVDRDAGYVIFWVPKDWPRLTGQLGYICWLDERKAGDMVYSRTKGLISSWTRGLLRRF